MRDRPYNENPIYNTEVHRRTAEILYKTGCDPSIVAAMLLQDVVHKPVLNPRKTVSPDMAVQSTFYPDVRNWLNEYKLLNKLLLQNKSGRMTLIGARLMRIAANIEAIDRYIDTTKRYIDHTNEKIKAIEESAPSTIKDHMIFNERLASYKELGAVKEQLMSMQEEFEDIKCYNIDLNVAFKGSMRRFNTLILDWMVKNGLETRPKPQSSFLDKRPRGGLE